METRTTTKISGSGAHTLPVEVAASYVKHDSASGRQCIFTASISMYGRLAYPFQSTPALFHFLSINIYCNVIYRRVLTPGSPTVQAPVSLCVARSVSCSNQRAQPGYPAIDGPRPKLNKLTAGGRTRSVFVLLDSNEKNESCVS